MRIELARRVKDLPPYLFAKIDEMKAKALDEGVDLINLSIGDPDIPTPAHIVDAMKKAVAKPEHHRYPSYEGMLSFRQAVSDWYRTRFGVEIDPETEVLTLIGSKEGIGHISLAFVNPGDVVLCSSPGYPVYSIGTLFAGGEPYRLSLLEKNDFFPDYDSIPKDILKRARMLFINYPNNPTTKTATREFFERTVEFARDNNIIVCHDAAYSEIYFEERPLSFMQIEGARDVGVEFHSLSKTYNMTGWRIGFVVGNREVIAGLGKIKTNLDSGVFQAIQEAGIVALRTEDPVLQDIRETYRERRDILYDGLRQAGIEVTKPLATFYVWARVPEGWSSEDFTIHLLQKAGVLVTPGVGFGPEGEGYIRFALTAPSDRIKEAVERIKKVL